MPGYQSGQAVLLRGNQRLFLFEQEIGVIGRASMAVQLEQINGSCNPWDMSFLIYFTDADGRPADPGACQIDIQTSDIDQDNQYLTAAQFTGGSAMYPGFSGRVKLLNFDAKYARAFVKNLTNAVYVSVLATR